MRTGRWDERRNSFGAAAQVYDWTRPDYPATAVDWLLGDAPRRVLDLGAGTGKLTRVLTAAGHQVLAVDPSEQMLATLHAGLPDVEARVGAAEAIPLPDGDVDAVVAGQAYHWFDHAVALPEIARVLRPGGVLGLVWNVRDDSEPWVAEFGRVVHHDLEGSDDEAARVADLGPAFGATETATFPHEQEMDAEHLVGLAASRSYLLTLPDHERQAVLDEVAVLARTHPDLAGRDGFVLRYETRCHRAARR